MSATQKGMELSCYYSLFGKNCDAYIFFSWKQRIIQCNDMVREFSNSNLIWICLIFIHFLIQIKLVCLKIKERTIDFFWNSYTIAFILFFSIQTISNGWKIFKVFFLLADDDLQLFWKFPDHVNSLNYALISRRKKIS